MTTNDGHPRGPDTGSRALRGLRHIASGRIVTQLVNWSLTALTIRLLQPSDYGLVATAGIITGLAQLLLDGGLGEVLIAQRDLTWGIQRAATTGALIVSTVIGAAILLIAPTASIYFHSPPLRAIISVSAFYLPLAALQVVPAARLSKEMKFGRLAIAQTASSIIQGLATLGMAYAGDGYWALIIGAFIGTGLRVAVLWSSLDTKPIPSIDLRTLRPLVRRSSHMIGQRLTYFVLDNFDIFLLSRFSGPAILGPYSVARNLAHTALNHISAIVNQVAMPHFASKIHRDEQLNSLLSVISLASIALLPLFWILAVVSQTALPLVFGNRWNHLVIPFMAFTLILPLRGVFSLMNSSVIGAGRTGTAFRNVLSWAAIMLPAMLIGLSKAADGLALSWTFAFPLVFYVGMARIARVYSTRISTLLRPMLQPATCAATSALTAESLLRMLSADLPPVILITGLCICSATIYAILLRLLSPRQYAHAIHTANRLLRN